MPEPQISNPSPLSQGAVLKSHYFKVCLGLLGLTYAINIDGIPLIRRNSAANIDGIPRQIDGIPNCACMLGRPACKHIRNSVATAPNFTRRGRFYHRKCLAVFCDGIRVLAAVLVFVYTQLRNLSTQIPKSRLHLFSNQY